MGRSDSEMRMAATVAKRNEDEERRVKMRKVLKRIGRPKGRVSEEGIARLARRVGLVSDIDDEKLTQEERERKVGNRSFSVAGDSVIVTVGLHDQIPQSVEVNGDVPEPDIAAGVLFRNLKETDDVPLTATLDRFALNLSYLATMDRLKKETDTDCFAALGGVYHSLQRLHEKEHEAASQQAGALRADVDATCKGSGKPQMHARQRLGLCLDYWQQNRYSSGEKAPGKSEMDVDGAGDTPHNHSKGSWTLLIGAEKCNAAKMPYVPLRISDQWLPEQIELPSELSGESIKWLEPTDDHDRLSRPCFLATLDPPVVLTFGAVDAVLKSFNVQSTPGLQSIPSYVSLLLSTAAGSHIVPPSTSNAFNSLRSTQEVVSIGEGKSRLVQHHFTLDNAKLDFGYLLQELPFSHPKQLVELLPTLRQWAGFGMLLSQSLDASSLSSIGAAKSRKSASQKITLDNIGQDQPGADDLHASLDVNLTLSTTPKPTLSITFRSRSHGGSTIYLDVEVLPNADVAVDIRDGLEFSDDEAKAKAEAKMAKALDVCWDLGVWIEWVRGQYV